jgi:hypothetical protein
MGPSSAFDPSAPQVPWAIVGGAALDDAKLDPSVIALIREKHPKSWTDAGTMGRDLNEAELGAMLRGFESVLAEDTAKNEYLHHAVIHRWLADAARARSAASGADEWSRLNTRVYAELFQTPAGDPWLGLVPPSVYTGLQDDGIVR